MAFTGPRILFVSSVATSAVSSAPATVMPLAAIAGAALGNALTIASCLSATRRSDAV